MEELMEEYFGEVRIEEALTDEILIISYEYNH